ncbi:MAG: chemotaxis protein CheD [Tenuifilum sp.]|uniref:chemotaxis protein CheD n=1 Tax=Tenuifilum sp. TaxID=2760880 RepID=UPI003099A113
MDHLKSHYLYPASLFADKEPHVVTTILGSCVAVCLYDSVLNQGGINHYMLPLWNGQGLASPRYGNIAIERLIERMVSLGSKKENLKAKVFGGGEVLETNLDNFHIGQRNIAIALELLAEHGIPIIAKSVGGNQGRKIEYNTATGEVRHKFIQKTLNPNEVKSISTKKTE